jgi:exopolyphosphatase/guanosine-5'-triphosphate,3'-diphosphate pyrophosphatase
MQAGVESAADGPATCRAVLDVGTNSVKLLVGRVEGRSVIPLFEEGEQTRLGAGLFRNGRLDPEAIQHTARAARDLLLRAHGYRPASVRALATAAAREAPNGRELADAIRAECGLELEVLSGDMEAAMAFRGVSSDPRLAHAPLLVGDVGGGSTELILGHSGERRFSRSCPLGTVRLWETIQPPDCPARADLERCRAEVESILEHHVVSPLRSARDRPPFSGPLTFVGVGGAATVMGRVTGKIETFDRGRIESMELTRALLTSLTEELWSLPLAARRRLPGLPPERADIILTGTVIYERILRALELPSMRLSTRGLRFAALMDPS